MCVYVILAMRIISQANQEARVTEYFNFDQLTWPEVAELQRDTPLVLPLGIGYDLMRLAESLSNPSRIGL